jgi:hypothetical protein
MAVAIDVIGPDAIADYDIIVDCYAESEKFVLIEDAVMVEAAVGEGNGEREERECRAKKTMSHGNEEKLVITCPTILDWTLSIPDT